MSVTYGKPARDNDLAPGCEGGHDDELVGMSAALVRPGYESRRGSRTGTSSDRQLGAGVEATSAEAPFRISHQLGARAFARVARGALADRPLHRHLLGTLLLTLQIMSRPAGADRKARAEAEKAYQPYVHDVGKIGACVPSPSLQPAFLLTPARARTPSLNTPGVGHGWPAPTCRAECSHTGTIARSAGRIKHL